MKVLNLRVLVILCVFVISSKLYLNVVFVLSSIFAGLSEFISTLKFFFTSSKQKFLLISIFISKSVLFILLL